MIYDLMAKGESYIQATETLWNEIPVEEQVLLYRPEFKWISPRAIKALKTYSNIKNMM